MKKGLILINAYTQSESELYQPNRLREELEIMGVNLAVKRNQRLDLDFCGIDLLFTETGFSVCEVNSNAFFAAYYGRKRRAGIRKTYYKKVYG